VGKKGVVRDIKTHIEDLARFAEYAARAGFSVRGVTHSPVKGPEGNIEYLGLLAPGPGDAAAPDFAAAAARAHAELPQKGGGTPQ
jgi:23S rRNA (cytidine1920-2'-O)/16S rRNA (cytidine1409-2'-O)-methyltransferase